MNATMRAHSLGEHHLKTPDHLKMATPEQMAKLHELYLRDHNGHLSPTGFMADAWCETTPVLTGVQGGGLVMVPWCNMILGIEKDGYAHS